MPTLLLLLALALCAPAASARLVAPGGYDGEVTQAFQEVVILHRNGHQQMLIRLLPQLPEHGRPPQQLVWILPLPATPTGFGQADPAVFEQARGMHIRLFGLARQQWNARTNFIFSLPGEGEAAPIDAARVPPGGNALHVGPYTVASMKSTGAAAVEELNEYLAARGLPRQDAAQLAYYSERSFTYLCVHFTPPDRTASMLELPALQVGFDSQDLYYPALLSARHGNFALSLVMISDKPLAVPGLTINGGRMNILGAEKVPLHNLWSVQPLAPLLAEATGKGAADVARWYVNRIETNGFNDMKDGKPAVTTWKDDVFFPVGTVADELPGFWYYGDLEISWPDRMFREHAIFVFVSGGAGMFLLLLWKGRQNRRRLRKQAGLES
ncbi:MAG: hypothetical protein KF754_07985 [Planctomycetes bacterium]|nr:hypothetical protein [Planctomycetota bacterium]